MPCTKILTTLRIRLLDRHIRIAEANDDDFVRRILNVHRALLTLTRRVEWFVQRHFLALIGITFLGEGGFHRSRFCSSSMSGESSPSYAEIAAVVALRTAFASFFVICPMGFIAR